MFVLLFSRDRQQHELYQGLKLVKEPASHAELNVHIVDLQPYFLLCLKTKLKMLSPLFSHYAETLALLNGRPARIAESDLQGCN